MALHTKTIITIGDLEINSFNHLYISQEINQHHFFELYCRNDTFSKLGEEAHKEFNGKEICVIIQAFSPIKGFKKGIFKGIIKNIIEKRSDIGGGDNAIIIRGQSPTILLDSGAHYHSFSNKNLKQIADEVLQGIQVNLLETEIKPLRDKTFPYIVQYEEGGFKFLQRMALRTGEWFYYTGDKLILGEVGHKETNLALGHDLSSFNIETNLIPVNFNYISNDFINNKIIESKAKNIKINTNGYMQQVLADSESLFLKEPVIFNQSAFEESKYQKELDMETKIEKAGKYANMVFVRGKSDNPGIFLGSVVSISDKTSGKNYGKFIITKIMHSCNGLGAYENSFEGVSADVEAPPYTSTNALPRARKQVAIVTNNDDPKGLGRIKVQFPWQKFTNQKTPWLRIASPYSGSNKGFHVLPEVGEEVMVGFENDNAEKPFIIGTVYNGTEKVGFLEKNNDIKTFRTRSGHTLLFNDRSTDPSIIITDRSGNIFKIDTKESSIYISAPKNIMISSENVEIRADENLVLGGKITSLSAGKNLSITGKKIASYADHIEQNSDFTNINAYEDIFVKAKNMNITTEEITEIVSKVIDALADDKITMSSGKIETKKK